jgi:tRNA pseudouridine55 synthase
VPSGILLLDKPLGLSSNAALQRVRALYARAKGGHVGSLDPLASGMLPICLGEATKVAGDLLEGRKCYRFTIALGSATDTGDSAGTICATAPIPTLTRADLEAVLTRFTGPQEQIPPMYSALKQDGERLYRLARAGRTVPRAPRTIEVFALELVAEPQAAVHEIELEALSSKGTYIRVLAEDIARALGSCGHVTALRRLYVEPFASGQMVTLESLSERAARGELPELLPADFPLQHLPAVRLAGSAARRLSNGERVAADAAAAHARVRLYDEAGVFLGLGETDAEGGVQPRRLLRTEAARDPS